MTTTNARLAQAMAREPSGRAAHEPKSMAQREDRTPAAPLLAIPAAAAAKPKVADPGYSPPLAVKLYCAAMPVLGLLVLAAWLTVWPARLGLPTRGAAFVLPAILTLCAAAGHLFPLRVTRNYKLTATDAIYFAALLLFGPPIAMISAALANVLAGIVLLRQKKRRVWDVFFNAGRPMVAIAVASVVFYSVMPLRATFDFDRSGLPQLYVLGLTALVLYGMDTFPTSIAVALLRKADPIKLWVAARRVDCFYAVARFLAALVTVLMVEDHSWGIVGMIFPYVLLHMALRRTISSRPQQDTQTSQVSLAEALADAVDQRSRYTLEHSRRVADYAVKLARLLALPQEQVERIRLAARVHDIGKLGIPDDVLFKENDLTPEERRRLAEHVEVAYDLLSRIPNYREGRELVRLCSVPFAEQTSDETARDEPLLLGAQIIGAADALDTMTSERPHRRAMSVFDALQEFRREVGARWHPAVVDALEALVAELRSRRPLPRLRLAA
jgi:HD domain-containing protein